MSLHNVIAPVPGETIMIQSKKSRKNSIITRLVFLEITGFILVLIVNWIGALFEPPYYSLVTNFKKIDMYETSFVSIIMMILGIYVVYCTIKLVRQIKYLEGFIVICASCKQVRIGEDWVPIEKVIADNSGLEMSHGICPVCAKKLYGDFLKD